MNNYLKLVEVWKGDCPEEARNDKFEEDLMLYFKGFESDLTGRIVEMYRDFLGMDDSNYDEHEFSLWNYQKAIVKSEKRFPSGGAFCFADFLLDSIVYAIILTGNFPGEIRVVSGSQIMEKVADDIDDFFEYYANDRFRLGVVL